MVLEGRTSVMSKEKMPNRNDPTAAGSFSTLHFEDRTVQLGQIA